MPVLAKADQAKLRKSLKDKVDELDKMIAVRDLKSNAEGCAKGTWPSPESMGATFGTAMEISLAGDAVIALVREIKKIKRNKKLFQLKIKSSKMGGGLDSTA